MQSFRVELGADSHPVHVGAGLLDETGRLARRAGLAAGRVLVVTDVNVARLFGERLMAALRASGFAPQVLEVAPGEPSKSLSTLQQVYDALIAAEVDRGGAIFAFGG